jgi:DNA-binding beta-propeller fold protein YncE
VLLATPDGFLKVYSYPDFEPQQSLQLGVVPYRMALDAATKTLYCAVDTRKQPPEPTYLGSGDLLVYDVTALLKPDGGAARPATGPAGAELKPEAVVKLGAALEGLSFSPDRRWLYVLNASDAKLLRLAAAKPAPDALAADLAAGSEGFCLSPDGKTIYTFASPQGHHRHLNGKPQLGKIQTLDADTLKVRKTSTITHDPLSMALDDKGLLYITTGSEDPSRLIVIDPDRGVEVGRWADLIYPSVVRIAPDRRRLYAACPDDNYSRFQSLAIPDDVKEKPAAAGGAGAQDTRPQQFAVSPDGRFLVAGGGFVLRLAKNPGDDLKLLKKVDPHVACAMDKDCDRVLLSAADGFLKVYSYPDFELQQSVRLGTVAYRMALDAAGKRLYCAVGDGKGLQPPTFRGTGDLYVYDVGELLKTPGKGK